MTHDVDDDPVGAAGGPSGIVHLDAAALSEAIRRREVSCVEVMSAYLDHIEELNPQVTAIVNLRPRADLLSEAGEKDRLLAAGEHQGWMHGFPHAVKDLIDAAGLPTTKGFFRPPFAARPATADALVVERIRAAGAIVIGKTNIPEFALGSHTYNEVFGTTRNAYRQTRSAGGSSGGAAVALALRMLPVADGSDFFGSLRNPAAWNNVLGLRPSFGRVPGSGADQFVQQATVEGPMARTATDLALLLQTMAGHDPRAPLSFPSDDLDARRLDRDPAGSRVAWFGDLGGYLPVEPEVLRLCAGALDTFRALGMEVEQRDELPTSAGFRGAEDLWPLWRVFRHWLSGGGLAPLHAEPRYRAAMKPEAVYEVEGLVVGVDGHPPITGLDTYQASVQRTALHRAFLRLFATCDFAVLPSAQLFPFDATQTWPREVAGVPMSSYHRWMEVTAVGTLLGGPVIALPVGFGADGLPMGIQVIAPQGREQALLQLARAWERHHDLVREHRPPLLR